MKIEISVRTAQLASIALKAMLATFEELPGDELEIIEKNHFFLADRELDEALRAFDSNDEEK